MPSNRGSRLTERTVDAIRPGGADAVHWDSHLTGFGLRVRRSGRKSYVVRTRVDGRLRWFTIGRHGPLTPDGAGRKRWRSAPTRGRASTPAPPGPGAEPTRPWPTCAGGSLRNTSGAIAGPARDGNTNAWWRGPSSRQLGR